MREHPEYKYRPRRKPKTLVKSPTPNNNNNNNNSQNQSSIKESPPHSQSKYSYSNYDINIPGMSQRPPVFPLTIPYANFDLTFAADLHSRIQAMYYQSYLNRSCSLNPFTPVENTTTTPSPPAISAAYGCTTKTSKSPPIALTPMHQTSPNGANVI